MLLIGLDASPTKVGWGAVSSDSGRVMRSGYAWLDGSPERIKTVLEQIDGLLSPAYPAAYRIEDAVIMRGPGGKTLNPDAALKAAVTQGMFWAITRELHPASVFHPIAPSSWRSKMHVKGRGREALKAAAVARASELLGVPVDNDDEAEGILIAMSLKVDLELGLVHRA